MRIRRDIVVLLTLLVAAGSALGLGMGRTAVGVAGVAGVAAQDASPAAMTTIAITITAHEFAFDGPTDVQAGLVTLTLANEGEFRHHAALFKLNEGVTTDQFVAGLETGEAFGLAVASGGPSTIPGGEQASAILRLDAGQYAVLCFVTGGDGVPHYAKGMTAFFTVRGEDAGEPDPAADGEVTLDDYSITLPQTTFSAGQSVWKVTNVGAENHELAILKLPEGMTADDYMAATMAAASGTPAPAPAASPAAEAPQPTVAGGMKALGTDVTGWAVLDLEPGEYVAVCFIPDAGGTPHAQLGMIAGFTVQ